MRAMGLGPRWGGVLLAALSVWVFGLAGASGRGEDAAAPASRRDRVVARVGGSRAITVGELEDRIAEMPAFQRATFGDHADAVRRRVLDEVLVPDALLVLAADARGIERRPATAYQLDRARAAASVRAIRARLGPASAIPQDDVRAFYEQSRARFESGARYEIWRILCKTRDDAARVLDSAKADPIPKTFETLAREHSQDKATYLRSGDLGFLDDDGVSTEPGLRVDPSVIRAAVRVRDGDLVPTPVEEGEYFSVVWRRGTIPAVHRPLAEVTTQIKEEIVSARSKDETDRLVVSLRASKLRALDEGPLDSLEVPSEPSRKHDD